MRKGLVKRLTAASLSIAALCCAYSAPCRAAPAGGGEGIVSPMYIVITGLGASLSRNSDGSLNCYGYTRVSSGYKAGVKVELQLNGVTIDSWYTSGSPTAKIDINQYVGSGTYRLKVTHYAYNSSGAAVESAVNYSNTVTK